MRSDFLQTLLEIARCTGQGKIRLQDMQFPPKAAQRFMQMLLKAASKLFFAVA